MLYAIEFFSNLIHQAFYRLVVSTILIAGFTKNKFNQNLQCLLLLSGILKFVDPTTNSSQSRLEHLFTIH